ncbi:MAG: helix-turn-helix domain-containing protein [Bacteroidales bacterium]|nr:helix-turn-helix domain-containing protein [Bacteroidales bacterium]
MDIQNHLDTYTKDENKSEKQKYLETINSANESIKNIFNVSESFQKELRNLIIHDSIENNQLSTRLKAAQNYFKPLLNEISKKIQHLITELELKKGVKQYIVELKDLNFQIYNKIIKLEKASVILEAVKENNNLTKDTFKNCNFILERTHRIEPFKRENIFKSKSNIEKVKENKIKTHEISYELYKTGCSIAEIAKERNLSVTTIETHLLKFVSDGKINISDFVSDEKSEEIIKVAKLLNTNTLKSIKEELGENYSYTEIKFALSHLQTT